MIFLQQTQTTAAAFLIVIWRTIMLRSCLILPGNLRPNAVERQFPQAAANCQERGH